MVARCQTYYRSHTRHDVAEECIIADCTGLHFRGSRRIMDYRHSPGALADSDQRLESDVCPLLFAISAEGTVTAYDEKDGVKFVYYLVWYNIGVILVANAIGLVVAMPRS